MTDWRNRETGNTPTSTSTIAGVTDVPRQNGPASIKPSLKVGGRLISHAYKMIEAIQPRQLILVAGDSDYVPLARDAVLNQASPSGYFNGKCGLMEPLLAEKVLTETYALANMKPSEIDDLAFQRISIQRKDVFTLSSVTEELDAISEVWWSARSAGEAAIGSWNSHICYPGRTTDAQGPAAMNRLPGKEASGIEEPRTAICPQTTITDPPAAHTTNVETPAFQSRVGESSGEPVSTAEKPALSPESTLLSSVLQLNAERWEQIRAVARAIPRSDIAKIAAALKNISMEVSLAWIADDERLSRTQDEISALKRLIEKGAPRPVVIWQQTLLRIHDEFKEALTLPEAVHRLKIWSQGALFGDALALLIDEGVLQVTDDGLIARGSLVRPAFRFACSKSLLDAMPKTQNA